MSREAQFRRRDKAWTSGPAVPIACACNARICGTLSCSCDRRVTVSAIWATPSRKTGELVFFSL